MSDFMDRFGLWTDLNIEKKNEKILGFDKNCLNLSFQMKCSPPTYFATVYFIIWMYIGVVINKKCFILIFNEKKATVTLLLNQRRIAAVTRERLWRRK